MITCIGLGLTRYCNATRVNYDLAKGMCIVYLTDRFAVRTLLAHKKSEARRTTIIYQLFHARISRKRKKNTSIREIAQYESFKSRHLHLQ